MNAAAEKWTEQEGLDLTPRRELTWIIPYYRNLPMLNVHIKNWLRYPTQLWEGLRVILVDDCSPTLERPHNHIRDLPVHIRDRFQVFRVLDDIPWNQHGARNLGAVHALTDWILLTDMDRLFLWWDMYKLLTVALNPYKSYRPIRIGMSSSSPPLLQSEKPEVNQFLCTKEKYWEAGGYDEDFCGVYGSDAFFLKALSKVAPFYQLPDVRVIRYSNDIVHGAATHDLPRRSLQNSRKRTQIREDKKAGKLSQKATNPCRFAWKEVEI